MSTPARDFIARLRTAFPDAPTRLKGDFEAEQCNTLSSFFRRSRDLQRRYEEGLIDRAQLPRRVKRRGAVYHLIEVEPHEQEAVWLILTAAAPLVASRAQAVGGDTRELLADADAALVYSLCGYDPRGASLLTWLRSDLTACFRSLTTQTQGIAPETTTSTTITERYVDPATSSAARPLSELADPERWGKTLSRSDEDLRELWDEYLSPGAEGYT